jgi:large subunit ribosomal protein L21
MYAIIRAGGKQAKVHEGDVLSVERIKDTETVSFTPLLIVGDDGTVISDRDALEKASVTAEILGASAGPKVDIFKYKAKTGYRRRQGHRQKYTTIKVTEIAAPGMKPKKAAKRAPSTDEATDTAGGDEPASATMKAEPAATKSAATKPAAKKSAATKPATKEPTAKKPAAAKSTAAKKPAAKKPAAKKPAAKKPAANKAEKE